MLTHAEQQRIYNSVPTSFSVDWAGQQYDYDNIPIWWADQSHDIELPEIVLGWNVQGVEKDDEQSLNQVTEYEPNENDSTVDITKGVRVYDEMYVEFSVEADLDSNGVPAAIRSNEFGGVLLDHFRFVFDQNSEGANGERPVVARVTGEPSVVPSRVDGDRRRRAQFQVRFHYMDTHVDTVDAADEVQWTVELDQNDDGSVDSSSSFSSGQ
ncbi:hypothetical protein HUG10_21550 (plasmid) [Halorarum halophilum]|uniref:Uncharacterized protein n=1 Tax=Halorarum halophilum TaxID=2743090 RepID=A0A7D5KIQ0_9EURY|nr:hypothetical protein [Halobaculum halophilum]QLG30176.1 hypothetical protein HUG10_21550 [Halobaculum halophilum]